MKKIVIISTVIILGILSIIYFNPFSNPEISVLDHMTKDNDGELDQICLVKNPPSESGELHELIREFNRNNPTLNGNFKRLFIKKHDFNLFPALTLTENIDYTSRYRTRNDINSIDFLADSNSFIDFEGKRITKLKVNIGDLWYYKK